MLVVAASADPGKKRPQKDPHYNHPIRVAMRENSRFMAALAESCSLPIDHPWFDTMNPHTIDDRCLRDICARAGIILKRREWRANARLDRRGRRPYMRKSCATERGDGFRLLVIRQGSSSSLGIGRGFVCGRALRTVALDCVTAGQVWPG